jgi:putative aldouronate transport system substrate-binding protein
MKRNYLCRILAVLMVLAMALTGLVGCSKSTTDDSTVTESKAEESKSEELDLVTLTHYVMMSDESDKDYVMNELNEYLGNSAIKVNIDLRMVDQSSYTDTMTALFSTGGDVDLLYTSNSQFNYAQHAGAEDFLELTDLLDKYGSGIKEVLPDYAWDAVTVGDGIYGVPMNKELVTINGLIFNSTMTDLLGLTDEMTNFQWNYLEDWDELIYKFKNLRDNDTTGEIVGVMEDGSDSLTGGFSQAKDYAMFQGVDTDMSFWWGLDEFTPGVGTNIKEINFFSSVDGDETAFSAYQTEEFAELAQLWARWTDDRIIDANYEYITNWYWLGNGVQPLISTSGRVTVNPSEIVNPNVNTVLYDMVLNTSQVNVSTRSYVQAATTAIAADSKNAERAMMYMNLLWTDEYVNTTLRFGVEGRHYDDNGDGTITFTAQGGQQNIWYSWYGTQFGGNMFVVKLPDTQPAGLLKALYDKNQNAENYSTKLDFAFDNSTVTAAVAAVNDPIETYKSLFIGQTASKDVDANLADFNAQLEANGINEIVAEVQKQLDAYLGK